MYIDNIPIYVPALQVINVMKVENETAVTKERFWPRLHPSKVLK